MNASEIKTPKKYDRSFNLRQWYREGYTDAIEGREQTNADDLARHQGNPAAKAYAEGYEAGKGSMSTSAPGDFTKGQHVRAIADQGAGPVGVVIVVQAIEGVTSIGVKWPTPIDAVTWYTLDQARDQLNGSS